MDGGEDTDPQCLTSSEGAGLLAAAGWQRAVVLGDSTAGVSAMSVVPGYARATWTDRVAGRRTARRTPAHGLPQPPVQT